MTPDTIVRRFFIPLSLGLLLSGQAAAVQITLNLVPAQSMMTFGGDYLGTKSEPANPFTAQDSPTFPTPGTTDADPTRPSNQTTLTGSITIDVDNLMAPTTIQILSADIDGTVTGSWLPEPQPLEGATADSDPPDPAAPADIGFKLVGFDCCDIAYGAVRDFAYNVVSEIPDPDGGGPQTATPVIEPVNTQGEFSSLSQHFVYRRGFFEYWVDPFILNERDRDDITGDSALNQHTYNEFNNTVTPIPDAPKSTYLVTGNLVTLSIPVEINIDNPGDLSQYFEGQIVATYELSAGLVGDHNGDGKVDAADYVVWRKTGTGDEQGYLDWRANFGSSAGSAAGLGSVGAVPEPSSILIACLGICWLSLGRQATRPGARFLS